MAEKLTVDALKNYRGFGNVCASHDPRYLANDLENDTFCDTWPFDDDPFRHCIHGNTDNMLPWLHNMMTSSMS